MSKDRLAKLRIRAQLATDNDDLRRVLERIAELADTLLHSQRGVGPANYEVQVYVPFLASAGVQPGWVTQQVGTRDLAVGIATGLGEKLGPTRVVVGKTIIWPPDLYLDEATEEPPNPKDKP